MFVRCLRYLSVVCCLMCLSVVCCLRCLSPFQVGKLHIGRSQGKGLGPRRQGRMRTTLVTVPVTVTRRRGEYAVDTTAPTGQ